jgi:uncharacterized membrane protein
MRIASAVHAIFAVTLIALSVLGFINSDLVPMWGPVPKTWPLRSALLYCCASVLLVSGAGLLFQRTAAFAARLLFGWLLAWLILVRVTQMVMSFGVNTWWAVAHMSVMTAAAWTLYVWFAGDRDATRIPLATGERGLRISRALFGLGLIPFGIAHFMYMNATAPLVPAWLPFHTFFGYATGATFVAAGLATITGIQGRLAAWLSTAQIGGFTVLVWVPVILKGGASLHHWREFITSVALTVAASMVADGYRTTKAP